MSVGKDRFVEIGKEAAEMLSRTRNILKERNVHNLLSLVRNSPLKFQNVAASYQALQALPHLPVPSLKHTFEKFLKSAQPFLNESELRATKEKLEEFQRDQELGPKLQQLLVIKAQQTDNWLADWWLHAAYLEYRNPVVVYSSPGQVFPPEDFQNENQRLEYTAKLILASLDYKNMIDSGSIPVEKMGNDSLDMNQYNKIFGTCRIPGLKRDTLEFNPQSKHIIIVKNNNYFKLRVINHSDQFPNVTELISALQDITEQARDSGQAIGILTADHRDNWGKIYHEHLMIDPVNVRSVREIQTSLFLVCLDNPMPKYSGNIRTDAGKQLIHGGGSNGNAANRWFDKTVQFVIGEDGIVGMTYEHSPSEGQPIAVMVDYLVNYIKSDVWNSLPDTAIDPDNEPEKLNFNLDERLNYDIKISSKKIDKLAGNLDMDSFQFQMFGKNFIKSQKLSPDSFIQMAIQYAFYRIHRVPGAHYESAATRKYIHGRTETIRSCSNESITFAEMMLDTSKSDQDKVTALQNAIKAHKKYTVEALNGLGVDRHILGLKLIAAENNIETPDVFKDIAFTRSAHMRLSTSQVATKCDGFMCYGPLVDDGYGCCYNPRDNDINFGVSAFVKCPETSATKFRKALEESLEDMHNILSKTQKSKL